MNHLIRWLDNTSLTARVSSLILGMMLLLALLTAQLQWVEYQAEVDLASTQQRAGQGLQRIDRVYIDWLILKNALDTRPIVSRTAGQPPSSRRDPALLQANEAFLTALHDAQATFGESPALLGQLNELNGHVQGYIQLLTTPSADPTQTAWLAAGAAAITHTIEQMRTELANQTSSALNRAQDHLAQARIRTWVLLLLALALGLIWGWLIVHSIRSPLLRLFAHAERMAEGNLSEEIPHTASGNEIGQMARLIAQLQASSRQTQAEHWIKSRQASLLTLMQGTKSFTELTRQILDFLCPELDAAQGGFYIFDPRQRILRLLGGYAFTERKAHHPYFHLGEGLVGQCALERVPLVIQEPPPGYFTVTSSLGQGTPGQLYLVPILAQQRILGVIELATFGPMSATQWQLLEAVLPLISLSIEMLEQRGANAEAELTPLTARPDNPQTNH